MRRRSKGSGQPQQGAVERPRLLLAPDLLREKLNKRSELGHGILEKSIGAQADLDAAREEYKRWSRYNRDLLGSSFSSNVISDEYEEQGTRYVYSLNASFQEEVNEFKYIGRSKLSYLEPTIERLELFDVDIDVSHHQPKNISNLN